MSQSAALFGGPQQLQTKHLLQFKAGKMVVKSDNWVHADPRKGWVYVYQSSDGKLHFCWIDRKTCLVEDNFVIGTQQAEFKRVPHCTTGRVYLLQFKNSKRFFIWMQEPNGKNDANICSRINSFINSPTQFTPPTSDWLSSFGGFNQFSQSDLLALLSMGVGLGSGLSTDSDVSSAQATAVTIGRHLNTGHLESLPIPTSVLGSTVTTPNVPAEVTPTQPSSGGKRDGKKIQLQDLRNILSSVSEATKKSETPIDLNDALNVDSLRGLLEKPEIQARLLPHLPDTGDSSDHLSNLTTNIRSSQFKSMLKSFSVAFQSGELSSVLAQFHLGAKADEAARRGDLIAFAQALQSDATSSASTTAPSAVSSTTQPVVASDKGENEGDEAKVDKDQSSDAEKDETAMDTD